MIPFFLVDQVPSRIGNRLIRRGICPARYRMTGTARASNPAERRQAEIAPPFSDEDNFGFRRPYGKSVGQWKILAAPYSSAFN
jgi:hypothetical protein